MESRRVDPAGIALREGPSGETPGSVRDQRNHVGHRGSSATTLSLPRSGKGRRSAQTCHSPDDLTYPTLSSLRDNIPPHKGEGEEQPQPSVHSVVTDSTMMMARTNGISLVMRQNRPE